MSNEALAIQCLMKLGGCTIETLKLLKEFQAFVRGRHMKISTFQTNKIQKPVFGNQEFRNCTMLGAVDLHTSERRHVNCCP